MFTYRPIAVFDLSELDLSALDSLNLKDGSSQAVLDAKNNSTDLTTPYPVIRGIVSSTPTQDFLTAFIIGVEGRANLLGSFNISGMAGVSGTSNPTDKRPNVVMGGDFDVNYSGSESSVQAGSLYGVRTQVRITGGGYYNHIMGVKVNPPTLSNGSTALKVWGIYIANVDVSGGTDYAALKIEGTGINNSIEFGNDVKIYELQSGRLALNSDLVFDNAKYLRFNDSSGVSRGQIGVVSGGAFNFLHNNTFTFKSSSVSDSHNFDVKNNTDTLFRVKMGTGNVGIGTTAPTSKLQVVGLDEYTDNADALSNGLTIGAFYRTGDLLKVVH